MNRSEKKFFRIVLKVLVLCFLGMLSIQAKPPNKIKILTSIFPFYEFAQVICGDRGEVEILIPPGAEVHTWKPRPSDIVKLAKADLFIGVGPVLEPWLDGIIKSVKNPDLKIIHASRILALEEEEHEAQEHSHEHEGIDPHVWLNFEFDIQIVENIGDVLSQMDPNHADLFLENTADCVQRLKDLDRKYQKTLDTCGIRTFIMGGHSAFGYMARRYNLTQISVFGVNPDSLPSPRKLIEVIRLAKELGIKVIFYEAALSDEVARMVAREVGAQTLTLNPGANLTREELQSGVSFFDIMEKNLENLKIGLSCR